MSTAAPPTRNGVALRVATPADEPFLRALFESSRPHLALIPLPAEQLRDLMQLSTLEAVFTQLVEQQDMERTARDIADALKA